MKNYVNANSKNSFRRSAFLGIVTGFVVAAVSIAGVAEAVQASTPPDPAVKAALLTQSRAVLASGATAFVGTVVTPTRTTSVSAGVSNRVNGRLARVSDEFQMGSTTKTVTATVALQLVGEGVLSLNDTVEKWLPHRIPNGQSITLRMLLQHTSGLFDYTSDDDFGAKLIQHPKRTYSFDDLLAVALKHKPNFAPGSGWSYSNTGFLVTGMILEKASGKTIQSLITSRVIKPLHLTSTYWAKDAKFHGRHLHGYYRTTPGGSTYVDVSPYSVSWASAAGSLISTTADLGTFERALQSGELLKPAQLTQMRTTVEIPGTGGQYAYGLGLMRITTPDGYVWGHTGGTLGYLTQAWASEDGTRSLTENVPTGAATPAGPDTIVEQAASGAATALFGALTN